MHCSEFPVTALLFLSLQLVATASAQSSERADLRALRDQAGAIQEAASGTTLPDWLRNPPDPSARAGETLGTAERERLHRLTTAQMPAVTDAKATATRPQLRRKRSRS